MSAVTNGVDPFELAASLVFVAPLAIVLFFAVRAQLRGLGHVLRAIRQYRTDPIDVGDVVADGGNETVSVSGAARLEPGADPVEAPFSGRRCCYCEYRVLERQSRGSEGSTWRSTHEGTLGGPFRVADGSGEVTVDPGGASVDGRSETIAEVDREEEPPSSLVNRLWEHDEIGSDEIWTVTRESRNPRLYEERRVERGADVHVVGRVDGSPSGADGEATIALDGDEVTLTVGSHRDTARGIARTGLATFLVATFAVLLVGAFLYVIVVQGFLEGSAGTARWLAHSR